MTKIVKIADSAMMRPAIATLPRYGRFHGCCISETDIAAALIGFTFTHTGCPDLPDVSGPTTDAGSRPPVRWQSCTRVVGSLLTTRASRHPKDHSLPWLL